MTYYPTEERHTSSHSGSLAPDLVVRLRDARHRSGLTQKQAAELSGVGLKTISSFEVGHRIEGMKVAQLMALLRAYRTTPEQFFSGDYAEELAEIHRVPMAPVHPSDAELDAIALRMLGREAVQ